MYTACTHTEPYAYTRAPSVARHDPKFSPVLCVTAAVVFEKEEASCLPAAIRIPPCSKIDEVCVRKGDAVLVVVGAHAALAFAGDGSTGIAGSMVFVTKGKEHGGALFVVDTDGVCHGVVTGAGVRPVKPPEDRFPWDDGQNIVIQQPQPQQQTNVVSGVNNVVIGGPSQITGNHNVVIGKLPAARVATGEVFLSSNAGQLVSRWDAAGQMYLPVVPSASGTTVPAKMEPNTYAPGIDPVTALPMWTIMDKSGQIKTVRFPSSSSSSPPTPAAPSEVVTVTLRPQDLTQATGRATVRVDYAVATASGRAVSVPSVFVDGAAEIGFVLYGCRSGRFTLDAVVGAEAAATIENIELSTTQARIRGRFVAKTAAGPVAQSAGQTATLAFVAERPDDAKFGAVAGGVEVIGVQFGALPPPGGPGCHILALCFTVQPL